MKIAPLPHRLILIGLVALIYALTGWLSLRLSIPPDYVSMVFLPAGLAMGVTLVYGAVALPGVFLGSLLVQLMASAQAGVTGWSWTLLISPSGSVLQAALGAYLARRISHYPDPLDTPPSVMRLLLICAPVSGLVNASLSVPALVWSGVIPAAEALFSWWTWWLGDSVGMALCLPLILVFLGRPAEQWRARRRAVAVPLVLAMLLGGLGFAQIRGWESQRLVDKLAEESKEFASLLQRRLNAQEDGVLAVSYLLGKTGATNQVEFAEAVRPWLDRYPGTQDFGWSPRIASRQRPAYEARFFTIRGRRLDGQGYTAPEKDEYFPITLVEPLIPNQRARGLDVTEFPVTATTVAAARATGRATVSEAIRLAHGAGDTLGVVMYQMVTDPGRPGEIRGMLSAAFRIDDELQATLGSQQAHRLSICLVDVAAAADNKRLSGPPGCDAPGWLRPGLSQHLPIVFGARTWELRFRAEELFLAESRNWSAWASLAMGLVAIAMLGAFLLVMTGDARRTQSLVEQRTAELAQLAHFDALTGLPNRSSWFLRSEVALQSAKRHGYSLVVLFLDLDHFKHINDTMGHAMGDELLQSLTGRLQSCLRGEDLLARIGGDEFVALLPRVRNNEDAAAVAEKLLAALREPIELGAQEISLSITMGLACYPEDGDTLETLLQHADTAMYAAKAAGRNGYQFFRPEMNARVSESLFIKNGLRRALDRQELFLVYQPQIDARTGEVTGVEALLRWLHPEHGLIPPDRFIPVAEDSGLIEPIGAWVLEQACRQLQSWHQQGFPTLMMAVNISALQFHKPSFVATVRQALFSSGVRAQRLELEITETLLMQPLQELHERLNELASMGLTFALDDFGTGYSSLGYLKRLPIHRIKLDKSFVADLPGDTEDEAVVRAALSMAKDLGLQCVAEGVETREQYDYLADHDCEYLQGYYIARPMPAQEFLAWLQGYESRRKAQQQPA